MKHAPVFRVPATCVACGLTVMPQCRGRWDGQKGMRGAANRGQQLQAGCLVARVLGCFGSEGSGSNESGGTFSLPLHRLGTTIACSV